MPAAWNNPQFNMGYQGPTNRGYQGPTMPMTGLPTYVNAPTPTMMPKPPTNAYGQNPAAFMAQRGLTGADIGANPNLAWEMFFGPRPGQAPSGGMQSGYTGPLTTLPNALRGSSTLGTRPYSGPIVDNLRGG